MGEVRSNSYSFFILDDHAITQRGLVYILKNQYGSVQVAVADNEADLLDHLKKQSYDLIFMDLNIPNFDPLSFLPRLKTLYPEQKVLVYSMHPEQVFAKRVIKLGANGYLEKKQEEQEIYRAIDVILQGGIYLSPAMSKILFRGAAKGAKETGFDSLSERELEVCLQILQGKTAPEISKTLNIHPSTVGTYKIRVFQKLEVKNVVQLIQLARVHGLA